jgi:hypothetical protein
MGLVAFLLLMIVQAESPGLKLMPVMEIVSPPVPLAGGPRVIVGNVVAVNVVDAWSPLLPVIVTA